ncbi:MAG: hypothetical protein GTO46_13410 [Gemmatimonadetes bacterium]|nr:hypothetical protein [Gemmatimonadota bacterium]NIO32578.1 hypothetical protein [Gemmatimonadota bacterium]
MAAKGKAVVFGVLVWLIPFITALLISPLRESARPLFESIMPVVVTVATATFALLYFRRVSTNHLREGVLLGALWYAISVVIDLPLMLTGPIGMSFGEYMADIGLTYLIIPTVTIGLGLACGQVAASAGAPVTTD